MASIPISLPCLFLALTLTPAALTSTGQEVLEQNCSACHATASPMGGLDLRTRESLLRGGRRGAAIVPGDSARSLIFRAVAGTGALKMPPGKRLPAEAVETVRQWIDAGAPWQNPDDLWAFQPLRKSPPSSTVATFIRQQPHEIGVQPSP